MHTPLLFRQTEASAPAPTPEKRGTVYTKPEITELVLDMAGYDVGSDLAARFAVECGGDRVFINRDETFVGQSRLLPLDVASDMSSGRLEGAGNYLINPWDDDGLVNLRQYPRLKGCLERLREAFGRRYDEARPGGQAGLGIFLPQHISRDTTARTISTLRPCPYNSSVRRGLNRHCRRRAGA